MTKLFLFLAFVIVPVATACVRPAGTLITISADRKSLTFISQGHTGPLMITAPGKATNGHMEVRIPHEGGIPNFYTFGFGDWETGDLFIQKNVKGDGGWAMHPVKTSNSTSGTADIDVPVVAGLWGVPVWACPTK